MPFLRLKNQMEWLEENTQPSSLNALKKTFDKKWKSHSSNSFIPFPLVDTVALHACYCIFKHLKWVHSQLFRAVVIETFVSEYKVNRASFEDVFQNMILTADPKCQLEVKSDKEFLLYILVQTMTATSKNDIVDELGLGVEILTKLNNAAHSMDSTNSSNSTALFLPKIDKLYSEIMLELSDELAKSPWKINSYKIKFSLSKLPAPWDILLEELNGSWILQLLVEIESSTQPDTKNISNFLEKKFPIFEQNSLPSSAESLLKSLASNQLIYLSPSDKQKKSPSNIWHLTEYGRSISAETYAYQEKKNNNKQLPTLQKIRQLNGPWQAALINALPVTAETSTLLMSLLASMQPIHPESYQPIIKKLAVSVKHDAISDALELRLRKTTTAGLRKAISSSCTEISPSKSLSVLLP